MKRTSVIIFLAGVIITIYCIIYFRPVLDVVDSDTMTVNPGGDKVAPWPLFVGLYTAFVGAVFYYVSHSSRKPDPTDI